MNELQSQGSENEKWDATAVTRGFEVNFYGHVMCRLSQACGILTDGFDWNRKPLDTGVTQKMGQ
jgi:hypothetical protein